MIRGQRGFHSMNLELTFMPILATNSYMSKSSFHVYFNIMSHF